MNITSKELIHETHLKKLYQKKKVFFMILIKFEILYFKNSGEFHVKKIHVIFT